jgi:glutamate--cysteine ligase
MGQKASAAGDPVAPTDVVPDRAAAEGYVAKVCFKTGPPRRVGVELEWTVHNTRDPGLPLSPAVVAQALGEHAPASLSSDSPRLPLPHGGVVTLEPGGQVEISSPPYESLAQLHAAVSADVGYLAARLGRVGLRLGDHGCDPHRPARRILDTPRYTAMERTFDRIGPAGRSMMCSTAGVQVCLDAGTPDRVSARWQALHTLGPVMIAVFANSRRLSGVDTGWVSSRMRTWYDTDPGRTLPPESDPDPVAAWVRRVLDTPLLCLRRAGGDWSAPPGVSFADWIAGVLAPAPTFDDLDYHISTLFPPVRPRGYLEVRYLDAQPATDAVLGADGWLAPAAVLAALFADEDTVDEAARRAAPAADRWSQAARHGLGDPVIAAAAAGVLDLACHHLDRTGLPQAVVAAVTGAVALRLHRPDQLSTKD